MYVWVFINIFTSIFLLIFPLRKFSLQAIVVQMNHPRPRSPGPLARLFAPVSCVGNSFLFDSCWSHECPVYTRVSDQVPAWAQVFITVHLATQHVEKVYIHMHDPNFKQFQPHPYFVYSIYTYLFPQPLWLQYVFFPPSIYLSGSASVICINLCIHYLSAMGSLLQLLYMLQLPIGFMSPVSFGHFPRVHHRGCLAPPALCVFYSLFSAPGRNEYPQQSGEPPQHLAVSSIPGGLQEDDASLDDQQAGTRRRARSRTRGSSIAVATAAAWDPAVPVCHSQSNCWLGFWYYGSKSWNGTN